MVRVFWESTHAMARAPCWSSSQRKGSDAVSARDGVCAAAVRIPVNMAMMQVTVRIRMAALAGWMLIPGNYRPYRACGPGNRLTFG